MSSRNEISDALLARLRDELSEVKTWLDRPQVLEQVPVEQQPAAYVVLDEGDNNPEPASKWTIKAGVYLVATSASAQGPRRVVNELVDAVETACRRKQGETVSRAAGGYWTTLGDRVFAVRPLHHEVVVPMTPAGVEGDKGMAFVDLEIISPG